MEWSKVKSVAKEVVLPGDRLNTKVLNTMKTISDTVGATLGPGGRPVLIERQEFGLPGMVTKDGVTVFRSLGFSDPVAHSVMESARDAATRTVSEAGDGTTTATILSYALVKYTQEYLKKNPGTSPQSLVHGIQNVFDNVIEPLIKKLAIKVKFDSTRGQRILRDVARVSANGDKELADAVIEAYRLVGDNGTISIIEQSGPSGFKVERIHGFPIPIGYEESCGKFGSAFINDGAANRVYLRNPQFVLYNGTCSDVQGVVSILEKIQGSWLNRPGVPQHDPSQPYITSPNMVLVCNGFSESVLGTLALNMPEAGSINVVPLVIPRSPIQNNEVHFLDDLAAITGATVLNSLSRPLDSFEMKDLGRVSVTDIDGIESDGGFEMYRYRSTVVGQNDPDEIADRAEAVAAMIESAASELDSRLMKERLACLTGGIAKLVVVGGTSGELRERKDRCDDAVQAVKGAIRFGALPGAGWTLMRVANEIRDSDCSESVKQVLVPALWEPVRKLLENVGLNADDITSKLGGYLRMALEKSKYAKVLSLPDLEWVSAVKTGLLDSTPAVLEALRSAISIASLLGSLGGIVVFERDRELERSEAEANSDFIRNANVNQANERA